MRSIWIVLLLVCSTVSVLAGDVFCRYELSGESYYGKVVGHTIYQLSNAPWCGGEPTGHEVDVSKVRLLHPSEPTVILGCSGTYREAWEGGKKPFKTIRWFLKPPSAAASPDDDVELPASLDELMVETELVIVIGKTVKNADLDEAKEAIFGYTVGNDIVGSKDSYYKLSGDKPREEDTILAPTLKIGDGFAPYGPYIYTGIDWRDRQRTLVVSNPDTNKKDVYEHNTSNLLYPPEKIVSDLSCVLTLNPGDIIFTGTTEALPAHAGDHMMVKIEGLCTIENNVSPPRIR